MESEVGSKADWTRIRIIHFTGNRFVKEGRLRLKEKEESRKILRELKKILQELEKQRLTEQVFCLVTTFG